MKQNAAECGFLPFLFATRQHAVKHKKGPNNAPRAPHTAGFPLSAISPDVQALADRGTIIHSVSFVGTARYYGPRCNLSDEKESKAPQKVL